MDEHKRTPLDDLPLPPGATLALSGRQVQLVRLALESLLWDIRRDEHLTAEIRALLVQLPAATVPLADAGPRPEVTSSIPAAPAPPVHEAATRPVRHARVVDPQLIRPSYAVYAHHV